MARQFELIVQKVLYEDGVLRVGCVVKGPGWLRFLIASVPLRDLPVRQILKDHAERPQTPTPDDDPLPLDWS